ncbi:UNVERIFIED_CONTAM: hypothetical protein ODW78_01565, partial [Salmonella enterica subsp. enterica serovar Enteritidis]
PFVARKPKAEVNYVANAWADLPGPQKGNGGVRDDPRKFRNFKTQRPERHYDNFGIFLSKAFNIMVGRNLIKPREKSAVPRMMGPREQEW